jgi:hypothetical protein
MEYIYSSPSAINRHIRVKENNSWNTTFTAAVLLPLVFLFTSIFKTGKMPRLSSKLINQIYAHCK